MKKIKCGKKTAAVTAAAVCTLLTGCEFMGWTVVRTDTLKQEAGTVEQSECPCTCDVCIYGSGGTAPESDAPETVSGYAEETARAETGSPVEDGQEPETASLVPETAQLSEIERLSEGEIAARKKQQANFVEARKTLYGMANSKDKTSRINQMDRQILANNTYDFSKKNIVFVGDSITEGIASAVDANGSLVSYTTYANSYLHFNRLLNHGKGGMMFSDYGGEELSLAINFGNVVNINSDIVVVFAGVNDYLSTSTNKRFGNIDNKESTAGYCGAVRYFMEQLKMYFSDREIFFVTMYNVAKTAESVYTDFEGQPTLDDYMEIQRKLAAEYGFNIIELYGIGFMDCADKESSDFYLRDGLHPKDNGNIALGEHIAAELSLYFGQK